MVRIRIGLLATMIVGTLYATVALLTGNEADFHAGVLVACIAFCGTGIADLITERNRERDVMRAYREAVWARRERE
jgi:hypothetical protein